MIFKKDGFKPQFWVANIMELFERLAYYGQATILSIFLRDHLKFNEIEAGQLSSLFGGLIYLLPIFAGALADKFGFRKAFSFAFLVLAIGYFLIGSTGMKIFSGFYSSFDSYWMLFFILIFTSIGGSFIKPSVLGTVAVTTTHETKSLGYAIYYWLVNTGAALGPILAFMVRDTFGIEFVYLVSAISCALMFFSTRLFFKEPTNAHEETEQDLKTVFTNLIKVLGNFRFISFLLIFGLYWVLFWQFFIIIPFYVIDFISPDAPIELLLSTGAWTIIIFQIPLNRLTNKITFNNTAFPTDSESSNQRFYIVDTPITYLCNPIEGTIRRYHDYEIRDDQNDVDTHNDLTNNPGLPLTNPAESSLVIDSISDCIFSIELGGNQISASITVTDPDSSESVKLFEQITIPNGL